MMKMGEMYRMGMVAEPERISFADRARVEPGEGEVLIKTRAASICGSDLHVYMGKHPSVQLPCAVGHELAGEVLEVGPGVSRLKPGDRVTVEPVVACGECHFCRRGAYHLCTNISFQYRVGQGAFAPYFIVTERWAHRLPDTLTYEQGALIEPLAVAVHAVHLAGIAPGHAVAIFGGGAIGLLTLQVARAAGAAPVVIVDINDFRLDFARRLGADAAINGLRENVLERIGELTEGLGADRAFEAVGLEQTLLQALQSLRKGGRAVVLGIFEEPTINLPANIFVQREIGLTGSQGYNWDFQTALALAGSGRINLQDMITHRMPLDRLQDAFDVITKPPRETIKVVLEP
jgi:2-desacetyl-2-hydroxyethyl bacteriochlorophyllide A dehydrogenase